MDKRQIELQARDTLMDIWAHKGSFGLNERSRPTEIFNPKLAAEILNIDFVEHETLGRRFGNGKERFEIAGMLNRQQNQIVVSRKFGFEVARFTAAHEIGHWLLHPHEVMHRDRPILGSTTEPRDRVESEADYFAACFLMPRKAVIKAFEETFDIDTPFIFTDNTAFRLQPGNHDVLMREGDKHDRAVALASAQSYGGRPFFSLAKQFGVSVSSMAIRLEELELFE